MLLKRRTYRKTAALIGLCMAGTLTLTGCLQDPNASESGAGGVGGFVDGGSPDGDGEVTVLGAFGGTEEEAFLASIADWEDESGIDVKYTADTDFTTTVKTRVTTGDAPDVALFPQPGGLLELAADGYVQPIDSYLDFDTLDRTLIPGFLEAARLNGRVYGSPMRMAVKSLVWYPKPSYEDAGYDTAPKTIQDLQTLAEKIKSDGTPPWCMAWESDQATGWVGTDWIEELVLRMWGPDVYDQWVSHEIPFNDKRIVQTFDEFGKVAQSDLVLGGVNTILNTGFADAMTPAFENPPKCYLQRQGNFATGFFPEEVQADLDNSVGLFVYPPFEGGYEGQPILGGGDIAALFNGDDEDAIEFMKYLTSDQFGGAWAGAGGWLSPHKTFDATNYPDETTRSIAELASAATVFRYDASDVMPKEVGSGTFWTGMVSWLDGSQSSEQATTAIEDSWPES